MFAELYLNLFILGTLTQENVNDKKDAGFATVEESNIGKGPVKQSK